MFLLGNTNDFWRLKIYSEWQNVADLQHIIVFTEKEIKLLDNKK